MHLLPTPTGPLVWGGHSQAQPLHHALPRLRRGGAGISGCFNLTGQGIAGKDGRSEVSV